MGSAITPRSGLWVDLGRQEYASTLRLQEELRRLRQAGEIPDTFLLVEHLPCVTVGRAGTSAHILVGDDVLAREGIAVHMTDRGGDVTYHGPGQLVCYPIVALADYGRDLHAHARRLEALMMETAGSFGVVSWRKRGFPGVWTTFGKVGSIGVAVRRWVTTHGAALNVSLDLRPFSLIVPCGLSGVTVTSLGEILGRLPDLVLARQAMREACEHAFCISLDECRRDELLKAALEPLDC